MEKLSLRIILERSAKRAAFLETKNKNKHETKKQKLGRIREVQADKRRLAICAVDLGASENGARREAGAARSLRVGAGSVAVQRRD